MKILVGLCFSMAVSYLVAALIHNIKNRRDYKDDPLTFWIIVIGLSHLAAIAFFAGIYALRSPYY